MSRSPRMRRVLSGLVSALLVASGLAVLAPAAASAEVPDQPPANHSLLVVKVGGERDPGTGVVQGLAGVQLQLREIGSGNDVVATCTSDADGDCVFEVSNADLDSNPNNNDFWIEQVNSFQNGSPAAADYFRNPEFVTSSNGISFGTDDYRVRYDNLPRNAVRTVAPGGSGVQTTSGIWQDSHSNPPALQQCGLNIALVSDLSYSVAMSNSLGALKNAASGFVNALDGTPSTVSLYTFGTTAPAPNTSVLLDRSTLDDSDVSDLLDAIDDYTISDQSYTNWDAAFRQLFGKGYDQVVMITDGNPTRSGIPADGTGAGTRFVELEHAIFSANTIKAQGSRIVAVGVGSSFDDGQNLRAISGPVSGSDFFTTNWEDLADELRELALGNCRGTVTVVKEVVPWNWDGQSAGTPAGGWTFGAEVDAGSVSPAQAVTADGNGAVNFDLEVPAVGAELTVVETPKDGYTFEQATCTLQGGGTPQFSEVANGFEVEVGPEDIVTCTVTNKAPQPTGSITVEKLWAVNGGTPTSVFPAGFTATPTVDGTQVEWGESTEKPAGTVEVGETGVTVPDGYCEVTAQQVTAVNGSAVAPVSVAGDATYDATVAPGASTTVTITNTVECVGMLYLFKKVSVGDADPAAWTLSATPATGDAIEGAHGVSGTVAPGVPYLLAESGGPAGYEQVSIGCSTSPTGPFDAVDDATVVVEAQTTVYCQFVNAGIAPELRLVKQVAGVDVPASKWTLSATADGHDPVSGDGVVDYTEVDAGVEYTLAETPVAGFDGSEFTASDWTCTVESGPDQGTETTGDRITLAFGQQVECVITNTVRDASPGFTKEAGTATSNGDGTWDITYQLTATNPSKLLAIEYDLVDEPDLPSGVEPVAALVKRGDTTVLDLAAWDGGDLAIADDAELAADSTETYDVTITVRIPSDVAAASLTCDENGNGFDNSATLTPAKGDPRTDDACVSVQPPTVSHEKHVTSVEQQQDGSWRIGYTVTVTATGDGAALYDLSDVPTFGGDIAIESATATADPAGQALVGTWNGDSQSVLADERAIAGGSQHEYEIVIVATVDVDATEADTDCTLVDGEDGTGFLNTATLVAGGSRSVAQDCASPAAPELDKQAISVTQNADASWTVVYQVDVTNPSSEASLVYQLEDEPGFPAGVTIVDVAVTKDGAAHAWADRTQPVATGQVLEPSDAGDSTKGVDSYVFTFTITVDPAVTGEALECSDLGAGYGLYNQAIVTSGDLDPITSDDCLPLDEAVVPLLSKEVAAGYPVQQADGDWSIRYTITVSTPEQTQQATRYDLEDVLEYGAGIGIVTASATGPDGAIAGWTGVAPDTALAADVLLPAGASHVYTVDVVASVAAGVTGTTAADCTEDDGEDGTGFLNSALLTVGSVNRTASDCASPASPLLDKRLVGTVKDDVTGNVTIDYEITITNPSDLALSYDLDDRLGFAFGVIIVDSAVTTAEPGITPSATWTGLDPDLGIVTGVTLAPHDEHVYAVTVVAKPSLLVEEGDQECVPDTPGKGYFNEAVLTSGEVVLTDDACAPIPDADLPTLPLPPEDPELPTLPLTGVAAMGAALVATSLLATGILFLLMMLARRRREA